MTISYEWGSIPSVVLTQLAQTRKSAWDGERVGLKFLVMERCPFALYLFNDANGGDNLVELLNAYAQTLERESCRKFVGEGAYNALRKLWDKRRITYFPGNQFAHNRPSVWAETHKSLFSSKIVLTHDWFVDSAVTTEGQKYGISAEQFRATNLLHEARHVIGDGYIEPDTYGNWNKEIAKHCFK